MLEEQHSVYYRDLGPTGEGRLVGTGSSVHLKQNQKAESKDASDAEDSNVSKCIRAGGTSRPQWADRRIFDEGESLLKMYWVFLEGRFCWF